MKPTLYGSVDLGGTNISAALAQADGQVLAELKRPTRSSEGPTAVLDRIGEMVNELTEKVGTSPVALGIGIPGLVDVTNGITRFLPNFPTNWPNVPVSSSLTRQVGCPVYILNDARTATLGELVFGHGREAGTLVFFGLGTGVGGGVVVDRQLHLGPLGAAGELGHQTILPDGPLCGCGNRGCLETLVSGPALSAEGVRLVLAGNAPKLFEFCEGDLAKVSPITMAAAAHAGEATVLAAIQRAAEWLGIGAANLVVTLHPDLIVIGGGVSEMGDLLLVPLREVIRRRVRMLPVDGVRVERSILGDRAGLMGGIALALRGGMNPKTT
jgi:glucokinase